MWQKIKKPLFLILTFQQSSRNLKSLNGFSRRKNLRVRPQELKRYSKIIWCEQFQELIRLLEIAILTKFVKLVLDLSIFRCKAFQIHLNLYEMNLTFNMLNYKPKRIQQVFLNFSRDLKRKLSNYFVTEKNWDFIVSARHCRENIVD